jgi:outer membrane lipoprotein-sorting protein
MGILVLAGMTRAQDDPAAILEKAIKAHGGEAKLAKIKGAKWKAKGKIFGTGDPAEYNGEWEVQFPSKYRMAFDTEFNGVPIKRIRVLNGDKGWTRDNKDDTQDLGAATIAEDKRQLTVQWLATTLLPLRDKAFTLTALKPAGLRAVTKDGPDVKLYFDKDKGLLQRYESMVKESVGKEVKQEVTYDDYKEVDGIQKAMKVTIRRDGKKFLEQEITDFKLLDKPDDRVFAKP